MNFPHINSRFVYFIFSFFLCDTALGGPKQLVQDYLRVSEDYVGVLSKKKIALSQYDEAKAAFFPSINLVTNYTDSKSIFNLGNQVLTSETAQYTSALEFMQPLYLGGKIIQAFKMRRMERDFARYDYLEGKNQVVAGFLEAVLSLGVLEGQYVVAKEMFSTQGRLLKTTRAKHKRGAVNPFDLDQVESDYYAYKSKLESVEMGLASTRARVAVLLKSPEVAGQVRALDFLEKVQFSPFRQEASFMLKKAELQLELAKINKALSLGDDYPSLSLSGRYGYQSSDFSGIGDSSKQIHSYGVTLTIPLFSGLSSVYKRRVGEAQVYSAQKLLEFSKRQSESSIEDLRLKVESAKRALEATSRWRVKAQSAFRKSVKAFGVGRANSLQVVQLQSAYERAESSYLESKKNLILLQTQLGSSLGDDVSERLNN